MPFCGSGTSVTAVSFYRITMAFAGNVVSIDCGEAMGTYQGVVVTVNPEDNSITIAQPFKNGSLCAVPKVTIRYDMLLIS